MNALTAALAACCAARCFEEKRLIAPSRRVGNQWLDTCARAGRPTLNVRVETLRSLAVELAAPTLARSGLAVAPRRAEALLVDRLLRGLLPGRLRYLRAAAPGSGLAAVVLASLAALRAQGVPAEHVRAGVLEDAGKADDVRLLAAEYERLLAAERLADYAHVLRAAAQRLRAEPDALGRETLVLVPEDFAPNGLERSLLEAVPAGRLVRLAVDPPGIPPDLRFASAVGEGNELRGVVRRCLERGTPLDEVEILYTDPGYAQALVEALAAVDRPGAALFADAAVDAPVTFAEGLPCTLSRPGRALAAWMRWMAAGYPQRALVAMLREGLLKTGEAEGEERFGLSRLAALLRSIPVGHGRERYLEKIDEAVAAARERLAGAGEDVAVEGGDAEGRLEEDAGQRRERLSRHLDALALLRSLVSRVLETSPPADAPAGDLARAALRFLATCVRSAGRFDGFAAEKLREELAEMVFWLGRTGGGTPEDVRAWLEALAAETRVGGSGPRPGCLHADRLRTGGHAGRPFVFVVGLDSGRFPGAGLQDPLLLDAERRRLDAQMPTAAGRLEETVREFGLLLARQRGEVTLSWAARAVVEDNDLFPSQIVLDAFRASRALPEAEQRDLVLAAQPPVSYAPELPARALDLGEWWLWRFTGAETVANPGEVLALCAPHLARGLNAAAERGSVAFTTWDGRVPLAGADLDPASPSGKVLSSNGLETAGACPRKFFYRYALELEPPEELVVDPGRWLDPLTAGLLLHELFELYVREIIRAGLPADFARGRSRILELLENKLAEYRSKFPPPTPAVYASERDRFVTAAETFVREEEQHALETGSEPAYLEASLGLPPGDHGTALDTPEPLPIALPDGRTIRTRGRVDRIDRGRAPERGWEIWDYKTGGTWGFERADPFPEGRKIQPYLYFRMVGQRLREAVDSRAAVLSFGYFFPGAKGRGERIAWEAARLADGGRVLAELCAIIASGAFAATTDADKDCTHCEYRIVCGDVVAQAGASVRKILAGEPLLAAMARLRARSLGVADDGSGPGA